MTLTTAQQVRLRIQDIPTLVDETHYGDGLASSFLLPHHPIVSGSAFVPVGGTAWSATGATFNPSGAVAFATVISANSAFRTTYVRSTFTDEEIGHFTAVGGNVNGAALEAVQTLMFDGLKRARWAAPDGTTYDDTAAIGALKDLYSALKGEQEQEAIGQGGMPSWSVPDVRWWGY